jgi:hypothetical protein
MNGENAIVPMARQSPNRALPAPDALSSTRDSPGPDAPHRFRAAAKAVVAAQSLKLRAAEARFSVSILSVSVHRACEHPLLRTFLLEFEMETDSPL